MKQENLQMIVILAMISTTQLNFVILKIIVEQNGLMRKHILKFVPQIHTGLKLIPLLKHNSIIHLLMDHTNNPMYLNSILLGAIIMRSILVTILMSFLMILSHWINQISYCKDQMESNFNKLPSSMDMINKPTSMEVLKMIVFPVLNRMMMKLIIITQNLYGQIGMIFVKLPESNSEKLIQENKML